MHGTANDLPVELEIGDIHTRGEDWGGQIVRHVQLPPGTDFGPLLKGLRGDLCSCPHWGLILSGSIHLRYADGHEEVCRGGDLYYWPGGHTAWTDEGVTFLELSPADGLRPVLEHIGAQLAQA